MLYLVFVSETTLFRTFLGLVHPTVMMKKRIHLLVFLLVSFCAQSNLAQDAKPVLTEEQKAKIGLLAEISSFPVIYGRKDDNLPKRMKVRGVIEEVTFIPMSCGVICWSGTAKIKLLNKVKGYEPTYVYITVLCFTGRREDFINKIVEVKVIKLKAGKPLSCEGVANSIDSKGVPFYRLDKNQSLK
jgi:hypothetical protein